MFDSILIATDLGETSDEIVRSGAALAALTGAQIHVIHALGVEVAAYGPMTREASFVDPVAVAEGLLTNQIARTVPPAVNVGSYRVEIHSAHRAITERAAEVSADLIVLGPHRRRRLADEFLGGTADRVIRTVDAPCLLVRAPLSLPLRRVLVAFDLSDPARPALDLAIRWARTFPPAGTEPREAELTLLHVVPNEFRMPDFAFDEQVIEPELRREAAAAARRVAGRDVAIQTEVRWGNEPAAEVIGWAAENDTDLLVLATHGHGGLRRALVGSVAAGIARGAPCPVLLVPPTFRHHGESDPHSEGVVPPFGA